MPKDDICERNTFPVVSTNLFLHHVQIFIFHMADNFSDVSALLLHAKLAIIKNLTLKKFCFIIQCFELFCTQGKKKIVNVVEKFNRHQKDCEFLR